MQTLLDMMSRHDVKQRLLHEHAAVLVGHHGAIALAEVEDAIERLDAGTYGTCRTCGDAIEETVLSANCCARHCFDCEVTKAIDIPPQPAT